MKKSNPEGPDEQDNTTIQTTIVPVDVPADEPAPSGAQEFTLADLVLPPSFSEGLTVKREYVALSVGKPHAQWWNRTHPDPAYWLDTGIIELKEERESYIVSPALREAVRTELTLKTLALAQNRAGEIFIWAAKRPDSENKLDPWNTAARAAMQLARRRWVRISAGNGGYNVYTTDAPLPEPEWPDQTFEALLRIAFRGRFITDPNHTVLRRLRGEE
jgi:hypothetical protein